MKAKDVDFFERVKGQLNQLHIEVTTLSKSKPDNPINKLKLGFINEKLRAANEFLTGAFQPFKEFTVFNADELPTNSDVVMVLSQYLESLEGWRSAHLRQDENNEFRYYWDTDDGKKIPAEPPSRYRKP